MSFSPTVVLIAVDSAHHGFDTAPPAMNPDVQQNSDGPYYNVAKTPHSRPQTGDKRKSGDDAPEGPPSQRAKRNRYISIAWFVCFM